MTAVVIVAVVAAGYFFFRRSAKLTDKDTIVLADFSNTTGDPVFDGTLRQGLSVQLEQSPFLSLLSDERIAESLSLMAKPKDMRLTSELAREVCQRTASTTVLKGSIAQVGTQYLLTLRAINCSNGESLASTEAQAVDKNHVLDALGKVASEMRNKLGESLASVQKYNAPLEQVTTPSLQALQAYSEGIKLFEEQGGSAPIPPLKRAIELDPTFAMAYGVLGVTYGNLGEDGICSDNLRKAFELRERVSEREKYAISAIYYNWGTGEIDKSNQVYEEWARTYPREFVPPVNVGANYKWLGQYENALPRIVESIRLNPDSGVSYGFLASVYTALGRLDEAKAVYDRAVARKLEHPYIHATRYEVAFLEGDSAGMQRQVDWAIGKPSVEDELLSLYSDTEANAGHFEKAKVLSQRAVDSAQRNDLREAAAAWMLNAALREAEVGYLELAREHVNAALAIASSRDLETTAALALAQAGDTARAQTMATDLRGRSPLNTVLNGYWLPAIEAAVELRRGRGDNAVKLLEPASPYELSGAGPLYPAYIRGEAYIKLGDAQHALAEFQKLLDHRGIVLNFVTGSLAHLQIGRAYAMHGDTAKARAAYKDFLTLWKDADPDIPILKQTKAEYAKVQ